MKIHIAREKLSDGSHVYDVLVRDEDRSIQLHAMCEDDAWKLADKIGHAINDHTTLYNGADFRPEITCNY